MPDRNVFTTTGFVIALFMAYFAMADQSFGDFLVAAALLPFSQLCYYVAYKIWEMTTQQDVPPSTTATASTLRPWRTNAIIYGKVPGIPTLDELVAMRPLEFEQNVSQTFQRMGYETHLTGHRDQGVDVIATKGTERIAIQCKRYRGMVGNAAVQEVYGGAALHECTKSMVITTSGFTLSAQALAKVTGTTLVRGWEYVNMIREDIRNDEVDNA